MECLYQVLCMKRTLKTVCSRKAQCCSERETVLRENHIDRESKSLNLTIYLYICYDEHEAPISCNTTIYLSYIEPTSETYFSFKVCNTA